MPTSLYRRTFDAMAPTPADLRVPARAAVPSSAPVPTSLVRGAVRVAILVALTLAIGLSLVVGSARAADPWSRLGRPSVMVERGVLHELGAITGRDLEVADTTKFVNGP